MSKARNIATLSTVEVGTTAVPADVTTARAAARVAIV